MSVAFVENGVVVGMADENSAQQLQAECHPNATIIPARVDVAFNPETQVLQEAYPYMLDGEVYGVRAILLSDIAIADTVSAT